MDSSALILLKKAQRASSFLPFSPAFVPMLVSLLCLAPTVVIAFATSAVTTVTPYSIRMADSVIARGQGNGTEFKKASLSWQPTVDYAVSTYHNSLVSIMKSGLASPATEASYTAYIYRATDQVIAPNGTVVGILAGEEYALGILVFASA